MKKDRAKALMIQGTGSGVGKSVLVAAFGRILKEMGINVAPFKAQNMALNSYVTADGLEMGRAQVYQAEACGLQPDVRMNPILLKPSADNCSQVILLGRPAGNRNARDYYRRYKRHREIVQKTYDELAREYEVIVIEGAGSPAEINLQDRDLVNMQMAQYAGARVLIVGDIDRGGVFAWMKGTYDLIQEEYKPLVKGFLINKFRGDRSLLEPGIEMFEKGINLPILGVFPYFRDIWVDEEDAIPPQVRKLEVDTEKVVIGVVVPPHISNFTDFTPLTLEPDVSLRFLRSPAEIDLCDCLILPGSKATLANAVHLRKQGWDVRIKEACARGTAIVGICGGYQILGEKLFDPYGTESDVQETEGLGLLPVETTIEREKVLRQVCHRTIFSPVFPAGTSVFGYEIHMGRTRVKGHILPLVDTPETAVAVMSGHSPVLGTYIHGIFDSDQARRSFINWLRRQKGLSPYTSGFSYHLFRQEQLDKLAKVVRENCDLERILRLL
jgi:adenosylcobyric acid synthase